MTRMAGRLLRRWRGTRSLGEARRRSPPTPPIPPPPGPRAGPGPRRESGAAWQGIGLPAGSRGSVVRWGPEKAGSGQRAGWPNLPEARGLRRIDPVTDCPEAALIGSRARRVLADGGAGGQGGAFPPGASATPHGARPRAASRGRGWPALVLLAPLAAAAQGADRAPELGLRLEREGEGPVWLGQHVRVIATLRTPVRFAAAPLFPEPGLEGHAIILPNGATTPGSEREGGHSSVLLQHVYDLFPAGAGRLAVGPLTLSLPVGTEAGGVATARASSAPLVLEVRLPPGTDDPARLVTAPSLRLNVALEGDPARVPVGEAIVRTVTLTAGDSAAMLLPPMPWAAPEGVRAYPDPPRLTDHADRGTLSATRIDRAAFVPERPGRFALPGATLQWFEPSSGGMQVLSVPPLAFEAVPAAAAGGPAPGSSRRDWGLALGLMGGVMLFAALGRWGWRRRQRAGDPEAESFAALRRACRAGDARAAMAALLRWTALASPPGAPPTADRLAALTGVPALAAEAAALARRRYGTGSHETGWDGRALVAAARKARRAARHWAIPASQRASALPAFNPVAANRPVPRVTLPGWAR